MNIKTLQITSLITASIFCKTSFVFAQGSLTPSGPPAPSGVSLSQIEQSVLQVQQALTQSQQRTPISFAGSFISASGSYYVSTNLVGTSAGYGIYIAGDNITIDLNGFTLQGVPGSLSGIYIYGNHTNIVIRNGVVTGWGVDGVTFNYPFAAPQGMVVEHLAVTSNGHNGIVVGNSAVVSDCSVQNNQWLGIFAYGNNSRITHNALTGNDVGNTAGPSGISVEGNNNLIEENYVSGSTGTYGIGVGSGYTSNVVMKNSAIGWGQVYGFSVPPFNDLGPVGTAASSTSPFANIAH